MLCTKCNCDNTADARYCNQCATPLNRVCPKCAHLNAPEAKFCSQCAVALRGQAVDGSDASTSFVARGGVRLGPEPQDASAALDGERKTVTALFADIKGSTELMADLDPEVARAIIDPALKVVVVSDQIRDMPFLWVAGNDPARSESIRKVIERNAIALLSNFQREPLKIVLNVQVQQAIDLTVREAAPAQAVQVGADSIIEIVGRFWQAVETEASRCKNMRRFQQMLDRRKLSVQFSRTQQAPSHMVG